MAYTKETLIPFCRYYKGEEDCPFESGNESMLWFYERSWVYTYLNNQTNLFEDYLQEYSIAGLSQFPSGLGIPVTLMAVLFNRYQKWNMAGIDGFKRFIEEYYK